MVVGFTIFPTLCRRGSSLLYYFFVQSRGLKLRQVFQTQQMRDILGKKMWIQCTRFKGKYILGRGVGYIISLLAFVLFILVFKVQYNFLFPLNLGRKKLAKVCGAIQIPLDCNLGCGMNGFFQVIQNIFQRFWNFYYSPQVHAPKN